MVRISTVLPVQGEAGEHLAFADAALALAGHEVTDPAIRAVVEQAARHELTDEQAIAEIRRLVQG